MAEEEEVAERAEEEEVAVRVDGKYSFLVHLLIVILDNGK